MSQGLFLGQGRGWLVMSPPPSQGSLGNKTFLPTREVAVVASGGWPHIGFSPSYVREKKPWILGLYSVFIIWHTVYGMLLKTSLGGCMIDCSSHYSFPNYPSKRQMRPKKTKTTMRKGDTRFSQMVTTAFFCRATSSCLQNRPCNWQKKKWTTGQRSGGDSEWHSVLHFPI